MTSDWIPEDDWRTIVANVPIVSVDLLVRNDGGVLLGERTNEPAKGCWFVPGGRVRKRETRSEAVNRIAEEELGLSVEITESLGAFEHIYDSADIEGVDGKHYLANGYVVDVTGGQLDTDEQHERMRVFQSAPDSVHENIRAYVEKAETLTNWI